MLGSALGSFTSAIVYRLLNNQSWIFNQDHKAARSNCTVCSHVLSLPDLIPIFSWLWLRGKCRFCQEKISWRYIVIELVSACLSVLIFLWVGVERESLFLLAILPFLLAQIILFFEKKFISPQLCFIIGGGIILYGVIYYT